MSREEYLEQKITLENKIRFNESIHCKLVAARLRRELERLEKEHKLD